MSAQAQETGDTLQPVSSKKTRMTNLVYAWDQMLSLHLNDEADVHTGADADTKTDGSTEQEYYQLFRWIVDCFLSYAGQVGENLRALRLVVMTRRCAALVEICMWLARECQKNPGMKRPLFLEGVDLDRLLQVDAECCITDTAAVFCVPEWLEQYKKNGFFPLMVVLDDLMLHGRACNAFLHEIESELTGLCAQQGSWRSDEALLHDFAMSVYIDVYARSKRSLLLYMNYYDHFRAKQNYSLAQCRKLSYKIALAVASSTVSNVSSEWGLVGRGSRRLALPESVPGYVHLQTRLYDEKEEDKEDIQKIDHFLFFYPNPARPTAIGSLRLKYSAATGQPMLMPCFILAGASFGSYLRSIQALSAELSGTKCGDFLREQEAFCTQTEDLRDPQQLANAVNLMLSKLLYEDFFAKAMISRDSFSPNHCQLGRAFQTDRETFAGMYQQDMAKDAGTLLQAALHTLLEDAEPFWLQGEVSDLCSGDETYRAVLDVVADLGLASEKHAYWLYTQRSLYTGSQLSHIERQLPAHKIFQDVQEHCKERFAGKSADLMQATAYLMHMVDYGMAGFKWGLSEDDTALIRTEISAGEPSLFLKPRVYSDYLRILAELQRKCSLNHSPISRETDRLVARMGISDEKDRERLSQELAGFIDDLNQSGQDVSDWLFPLPFSVFLFDPAKVEDSVRNIREQNKEYYKRQAGLQNKQVLAYYLGA